MKGHAMHRDYSLEPQQTEFGTWSRGATSRRRWNLQQPSPMPTRRYVRDERYYPALSDRQWPEQQILQAPQWCSVDLRDGNQALPCPMEPGRKSVMFDLLLKTGFKEIEVGYPSASEADFLFVRKLIEEQMIPDDVTISVFTPARSDLIQRTFEAIEGVERCVVHLCLATACLWRDVVFRLSPEELVQVTLESAYQIDRLASRARGSQLRFEYSPETFNVTEPEFSLDICGKVITAWDACEDRPVTLNLPSTVETNTPNIYADQIEWMHRNLPRRDSVILSVHPHNDRGTAVASAELALMAGADRVEGTLFGNGERTGNVCLATLALNLFSSGVDPELDFSDIESVRQAVEFCNQLPVHPRHPYAGDLVYTAFSGTHQDAVAKGLASLELAAASAVREPAELRWQVPYLPIDPRDVGRSYDSVVRVNSQSGKGGIAHVLQTKYELTLPRELRVEFARRVQQVTDNEGIEINSRRLWTIFEDEYLGIRPGLMMETLSHEDDEGLTSVNVTAPTDGGPAVTVRGTGPDLIAAFTDALRRLDWPVRLEEQHHETLALSGRTAAYLKMSLDDRALWGVGVAKAYPDSIRDALLSWFTSALKLQENRALAIAAGPHTAQ